MPDSRNREIAARLRLLRRLASYINESQKQKAGPLHAPIMSRQALEDANALLVISGNAGKDLEAQSALGAFFWTRFVLGGAPADLRRSVTHFDPLYDQFAEDIPAKVREFLDEIEARMERAEELMEGVALPGNEWALDEAIALLREITSMVEDGHPALAVPFTGLAVALERRFKLLRLPDSRDLDDAVSAIDRALDLSRSDDQQVFMRQTFRLRFLITEYDETDDAGKLAAGFALGAQLLDEQDHPDPATLHAVLAHLHTRQFDRSMSLAEIDEAIRHGRKAVAWSKDSPELMDDLGVMLRRRGEYAGDTRDLTDAVRWHRQAKDGYPADHIDRLMVQNNLARGLIAVAGATRDRASVDEAIEILRNLTPEATARSHPDHRGFQQNLALGLNTLFTLTGDVSALEEQVAVLRHASADTDSRRGVVRDLQSDLGGALRRLAEQTSEPALLDESIAVHRNAVADVPSDDPAIGMAIFKLAVALRARFDVSGDETDRTEAIEHFHTIAQMDTTAPWLRAHTARRWGELEAHSGNWAAAADGLSLAVELLPRLASRNLERTDRERHLMYEPGLVPDAVAAVLHTGNVDRAAELFEQGRGVLTAQALDLQDIRQLTERDPELAAEFVRLRDAIDLSENSSRRHIWIAEWEELLPRIRRLDGFADFLYPMTAEQLRASAKDGPVVMVNISDYRSDALVIGTNGIAVLALPQVSRTEVDSHWLSFVVGVDMSIASGLTAEQAAKASGRVEHCLNWLWDAIVRPVLSHVGFTSPPPDETLRRMWWLPSGYLNFLPLHAASGWSDAGTRVSALDLVVSSYTPTVRSLMRARKLSQNAKPSIGPLIVAMLTTPGMPELPGAGDDAEFLKQQFPSAVALIDEGATKDEILQRMASFSWIHFSCHATSDSINPSASALFVAGAAELTVVEVSDQRVDGEFAFLAACRTSQTGMALVDESIHLAAAFQLAGYRHVVAAMWPIADAAASSVCRGVYNTIGRDRDSVEHSATAVHSAVKKIRVERPNNPVLWASYMHVGP